MFTGIIEAQGVICQHQATPDLVQLGIKMPQGLVGALKVGDSLSVNGVCLTMTQKKGAIAYFDLISETQRRTMLGKLPVGAQVNLERPLKWNGRLQGHLVLGHVDGTGRLERILPKGKGKSIQISFPKKMRRYFVEKGSVAVDGVSLTLGKIGSSAFWVHLIPHTLGSTNFQTLRRGGQVNLEADVLTKKALLNPLTRLKAAG